MPLAMPSPALSCASSIAQSPVPSSVPSTCESGQIESGPDSDSDIPESSHEPDDLEPGEGGAEDEEDDDMDNFMDASRAKPNMKEEIRDWHKLREQIKSDLATAHKQHDSLSQLNQFLILRNFATLWIKGIGCIAASQEIAWQWHDGTGIHFACQVRFLAHHYQLFECLPANSQGGDHG